ncbi:MAG: hypothetical protein ABH950_07850 [Candidatus Altiarchaeota archaeon]
MKSSSEGFVIDLGKDFSDNLAYRQNADKLFEEIASVPSREVTLDFRDVITMSRSFAHQYLYQKRKTGKEICEVNISKNLKQMFDIASDSKVRQNIINFNQMTVYSI